MVTKKVKKYVVYLATSPSGKKYVGVTGNLRKRKREHKHYANTPTSRKGDYAFPRALRRYGFHSFFWEELHFTSSIAEAKKLEIMEIASLKTTDSKFGYNITSGGDLSDNQNRRSGKEHHLFGVSVAEKYGFLNLEVIRRPVVRSDGKVYPSIRAASREIGLTPDAIFPALKGDTKTSGGWRWRYYDKAFTPEQHFDSLDAVPRSLPRKGVKVMRSDGREFKNLAEAARFMGARVSDLHRALSGVRKTYKQFIWRYTA